MSPNLGPSRWRVSGRTNGANTCVEAMTDGASVWVRNSTRPDGPTLTLPAAEWLELLDAIAVGRLQGASLGEPARVGTLQIVRTTDGTIEVTRASQPGIVLHYTPQEWAVFVAGVRDDGEFTLEWLLDGAAPSTVHRA